MYTLLQTYSITDIPYDESVFRFGPGTVTFLERIHNPILENFDDEFIAFTTTFPRPPKYGQAANSYYGFDIIW